MRRGLATFVVLTSCSLANGLDTCTTVPAPVGVNFRIDGRQTLESSAGIAVLPTGETVLLYNSTGRTPPNDDLEIRTARLSTAGARLDGCFTRDEREQILYQADVSDPTAQLSRAAQVVAPPVAAGVSFTGLALLTRKVGTASPQLIAVTMLPNGCFLPNATPF